MSLNFGYTTEYECITCGDEKRMTRDQAREYVSKFHNSNLTATSQLLLHINKQPRHIMIKEIKFKSGIILHEIKY